MVNRNLASVGGTLAATQAVLSHPELRMTAHTSGNVFVAFVDFVLVCCCVQLQ